MYDGAPHLDESYKEWIYFFPDKKSYERFESTIAPDNVFLSFSNLLAVVTDEKVDSNITDSLSFPVRIVSDIGLIVYLIQALKRK